MGVAYGSVTTMTVTALDSLASSATAGWQSDAIDNRTTGYHDIHIQVVVDFANTAPANSKGIYIFLASALDTVFTNPATGTQGTLTLLDVSTVPQSLRLASFQPYTTQDEVSEGVVISVAAIFGGVPPAQVSVCLINHSGAALAASGNSVKFRGVTIS